MVHSLSNITKKVSNTMDNKGSLEIAWCGSAPLVYFRSTTVFFYWFQFSPCVRAFQKLTKQTKIFCLYLSPKPSLLTHSHLPQSFRKKILCQPKVRKRKSPRDLAWSWPDSLLQGTWFFSIILLCFSLRLPLRGWQRLSLKLHRITAKR